MKGLELSKKFYCEYGEEMLETQFEDILPFLAIGLVGSGSECFGFDDETSKDHDFEPGFCIFIPDRSIIDSRTEFKLERAYAKLPKEFMGFKRSSLSPVGGNRHGVISIAEFYESKTGNPMGKLSIYDWLSVPEYSLAEATNGEVFVDNYGLFTEIRNRILDMPSDIRLKKLAGNLLLMGQSGQYNYSRCISRGETGAAQMAVFEFVKSAINTVFLLNKKYSPYYKWTFRALKNLSEFSFLAEDFEYLISTGNDEFSAKEKSKKIEQICEIIISGLKNAGLTDFDGTQMEGQAYSVNNMIKDGEVRNLHILSAV